MDICLYNAQIAQFDGPARLIAGEVHIRGDRIVYVGPPDATAPASARRIDCRGGLLLPGFKNAHAHAGMTFLRASAEDAPLQTWLTERVFPYEAKLTPDDILWLTKLAILEYVSGGVTAAFDMYYFRDSVAQAALETGFRTAITSGANDYGGSAEQSEAEYDRFTHMGPLVTYRIGIHGEYTTSLGLIRDHAVLCRRLRQPFFAHMNETEAEVAGCVARYGLRPVELFEREGAFAFGGGGFHMTHLSENEIAIARARGLTAVTCPASNLKLASGVAPVQELVKAGVRVAIGTDGPASNNALDPFREMYLVASLQKLRHGAAALDALDVLRMACVYGAHAMGFDDCDALAPGKSADLVLLDMDAPNLRPAHDPLRSVVYSGSKQNVRLTMVGGRILYEDGRFDIGVEPGRVYERADAIVRRMGLMR